LIFYYFFTLSTKICNTFKIEVFWEFHG
jgi:hypothetical protein